MKKLLLFLTLTLFVRGNTFAVAVSETSAQTVALNFYKSNAPGAANNNALRAVLNYTKSGTDGTVLFYVFNISPEQGFVIVSADDATEPVIGYSLESTFNATGSHVGINDWIETVSQKINAIITQQVPASSEITGLWNAYMQGVKVNDERTTTAGPLMTTTWNQEPYYNMYCPYNTTDKMYCVTGCVATGMAQIMKYWNFPAKGTGSYSYNDIPPNFTNNYGTQSANFGTTTYSWSSMPNSISANNTYIGTLMYQCGVSVAMNYGDDKQDGSGAWVFQSDAGGSNPCAQKSYATYFSYNASTMQGLHQSSYTAAAWITLLQNELNAGRPVQYEGWATAGGHTWVCDGYDVNNLFHMNWGWGGTDNGFYSLSNLNPNPYVFNSNDGALIGIQPLIATACNAPTGLSTTNVTATSATFNWGAASGAKSYNIQYRMVGTIVWSTGTSTINSYNATGLTSGKNYEWQVQTVCTSGSAAFTASATFTTTAVTCGIPAGLSAASISSTGATLTWGAVTGALSYTLQWKSASATSWTTLAGITTLSHPLTGLASCTSYEFQVLTVCSGGSGAYSSVYSFSTTGCTVTYCTSKGTTTMYEYINKVAIGSINNTSGDNKGYADFTAQSTNLAGGSTNTITLTPGFHGSVYKEYWNVWIDYNHNGVFTDAGEKAATGNSTGAIALSFTVPASALNGATRMRIQMEFGAYATSSCLTYSYGEVEDYTVNITGNAHIDFNGNDPGNTAESITGIMLYPNPAQDNLTIEFSGKQSSTVVNIYDLVGKKAITQEFIATEGQNKLNINTAILNKGIYIFEIINNGEVQRQKFMIER